MSIPPPETFTALSWRVSCDGASPALGHPRVWLQIPRETGYVDCSYCDARHVHVSRPDLLPDGAADRPGTSSATG
ncbi:MAG: zinc-finger domain-containing protein [Paracoccaceae bacterium]